MNKEQYNSLIVKEQEMICYIADIQTYEMIYISDAAMELYHLNHPDEYKGQKCFQLLQGLNSPCIFCSNCSLKKGEKYCWEHFNEKLQRWMAVEDTLVEVDGRLCRMEIARDVTEQKNKLSQLSVKLTVEETLVKCVETLVNEGDLNIAVNRFLEIIGCYYDADRSYIFETEFDKQIIQNSFEWCASGISKEIQNLQEVPMMCVDNWIEKFESTGEFFITSLNDELDHNELEYHILEAQGIKSLAAVPFKKDGRITGFLGIDNPKVNLDNWVLLHSVVNFIMEELEKRRLIQKLEYASYTDMLTGLKNRNEYIRVLQGLNTKTVQALGVIYVDINGLKATNDRYGHEAGDAVIIRAANILREQMGTPVFRIGGDEFVVLCEDIDRNIFEEKAQSLRDAFRQAEDCDVSIGSAWKEGAVVAEEEVMRADALMYTEKKIYYSRLAQAENAAGSVQHENI